MSTSTWKRAIIGGVFVIAGLNHFRRPAMYTSIMPPYLPEPELLVALSGYAEVALGAAVVVPRLSRWSGWGLIALLVAVFPANLNMALNPARYAAIPAWLLWLRLPLQAALIAWVYRWTQPRPHGPAQK